MRDISKKLEGGHFCCNMHVQKNFKIDFFKKRPMEYLFLSWNPLTNTPQHKTMANGCRQRPWPWRSQNGRVPGFYNQPILRYHAVQKKRNTCFHSILNGHNCWQNLFKDDYILWGKLILSKATIVVNIGLQVARPRVIERPKVSRHHIVPAQQSSLNIFGSNFFSFPCHF